MTDSVPDHPFLWLWETIARREHEWVTWTTLSWAIESMRVQDAGRFHFQYFFSTDALRQRRDCVHVTVWRCSLNSTVKKANCIVSVMNSRWDHSLWLLCCLINHLDLDSARLIPWLVLLYWVLLSTFISDSLIVQCLPCRETVEMNTRTHKKTTEDPSLDQTAFECWEWQAHQTVKDLPKKKKNIVWLTYSSWNVFHQLWAHLIIVPSNLYHWGC